MSDELGALQAAVQKNCHIADARHSGDYTLCIYLMKMREYYRWEKGYPLGANLPREDVGDWLRERETLWESLEVESFGDLPVADNYLDPFDTGAVNETLLPEGLVYSAGLGNQSRPHFFLGELESREQTDDFDVLISGKEHARELTAYPAMSHQGTIFIRRESLQRMLWEKIENWRWSKAENAMARAIACYDFDDNLQLALDQMTAHEMESVRLHEIGEVLAGQQLGETWHELLAELPHSKVELMLRAVRDHLADSLTTLPALVRDPDVASLHFYIGNLSNMRKHMYPALMDAYQRWVDQGDLSSLEKLAESGREHWSALAEDIIALYRRRPDPLAGAIESLIEEQRV